MKLIPVIDVMNGLVARAVGGRRDKYQTIRSVLTNSTGVAEVASAMLAATGSDSLYLADLDAIQGKPLTPLPPLVANRILLDRGITHPIPSRDPHIVPVVGLETASLDAAFPATDHGNAFSFDLFNGSLWKNWESWVSSPGAILALAHRVHSLHFRTWIVLDIGRVGGGAGPGSEGVIAQLRGEFPDVELLAGGGVRGWDDVKRLTDAGADGVLVASALHDGTLRNRSIP